MVDWVQILKLVILGIAVIALYSLAAGGGTAGKVFVLIIIAGGAWIYLRGEAARKILNPVTEYYRKLLLSCKLNRNPTLKRLILTGDRHNQQVVKGWITGGAITRKGKIYRFTKEPTPAVDDAGNAITDEQGVPAMVEKTVVRMVKDGDGNKRLDERADAFIVSYTPDWGGIYNIPLIGGWLWGMRGKEYLFCAYSSQLDSPYFFGDVVVRGLSTRFVGQMEFVNDWSLDVGAEDKILCEEVERETLQDYLTRLPAMQRAASDSSSAHIKNMDLLDDRLK